MGVTKVLGVYPPRASAEHGVHQMAVRVRAIRVAVPVPREMHRQYPSLLSKISCSSALWKCNMMCFRHGPLGQNEVSITLTTLSKAADDRLPSSVGLQIAPGRRYWRVSEVFTLNQRRWSIAPPHPECSAKNLSCTGVLSPVCHSADPDCPDRVILGGRIGTEWQKLGRTTCASHYIRT